MRFLPKSALPLSGRAPCNIFERLNKGILLVNDQSQSSPKTDRQIWMAVLARAEAKVLHDYFEAHGGLPVFQIMKPAETGTVMLEGRAGGSGRRFNAGEATMTRCVVRLEGQLGFSYALGRDKHKAVLAAVLDAALQDTAQHDQIMRELITPLLQQHNEAKLEASRKAAATKVEFFTLVRGDG
jgi:alpha-D-ribose 1-methylphosphonate 5-triphosphate synthase subunit PhnG